MPSRLESHDRKRYLRQIILLNLASAGLIIGFLFVVLPAFIKVLALRNLGTGGNDTQSTVLPARPTLSQPFDATSSADIKLSGNAVASSKVILLQNGAPSEETTSSEDGSFSFDVSLESGDNLFAAVVENTEKVRSNPSTSFTIRFVKDAPKLEVSEPADGTTITQQRANPVTIKGKTDPGNKIFINDGVQFVSNDGSFSGRVQLANGENTVVIKAVNTAQIETVKELKLTFSP